MVILLVEDDPLIAMSLEGTVFDAGHIVRGPASTAARALEMVDQGQLPDLGLVDINLRDGNGAGVGLARELLSRWCIPSFFVSAQNREARANRDAALGLITKPYSPKAILQSIDLAQQLMQGLPIDLSTVPPGIEMFSGTSFGGSHA